MKWRLAACVPLLSRPARFRRVGGRPTPRPLQAAFGTRICKGCHKELACAARL